MRQKLLVIKLGGAVVTYKDSPIPKARISTILDLSKEIKKILDRDYQIILVHGAGSFGHALTKKYNLHKGFQSDAQKLGFSLVTKSMLRLNKIIINQLLRAKVKPVSIVPHTFITQSKGTLNDFNTSIIETYLKLGLVPVLFGDLVPDDKWGCSVVSGDTIVCYLGQKLKADKIIFLSDVDGIYDSDPKKNPKAKLIPEVNNSNINQVLKGLSPTGREDVTGEMAGKILQIKNYLKQVPVWILNGQKTTAAARLADEVLIGTKLLFR